MWQIAKKSNGLQDSELVSKTRKASEKISENIYIVANDPSLAFYRIQEHVRKVIQPILDKRLEVIHLQNNLQGHCYDMEYSVGAIRGIENSEEFFRNIQELIKTSIFLKQQLNGVVRETSQRMETIMISNRGQNIGELQRSHTTLH
ncbi:BLOC-1-related complex subunit 8 homolog isoform X2 [Glossina fuscipes]|uniref:BLOC-1-related complex subunit 8 homolog isoform X2 n=1 Tax=Glossina fuscipes TaxID=7396 RepID=A0A9C6DZU7_9MUSC|nr:BLOC-1-related complex subunit 8 homolog isoform X2 [Glossina fuscipes]